MLNAVQQKQPQMPEAAAPAEERRTLLPAVDVVETATAFMVVTDLPGVEESAVEIAIDRNRLTLRARRAAAPPAGAELTYQEYTPVDYEREFTLGDKIDRDQVKATLKNGVLRLVLPKTREQQPRRIAVTAG